MRCGLSPRCDMDRVVDPEAMTWAQRGELELCETHSRLVAAAMERADRARTLAILNAPPPAVRPRVTIEDVILRLCSKKKGATYEAIKVACALLPGDDVFACFTRLLDEKKIVPRGGRSRGSFATVKA